MNGIFQGNPVMQCPPNCNHGNTARLWSFKEVRVTKLVGTDALKKKLLVYLKIARLQHMGNFYFPDQILDTVKLQFLSRLVLKHKQAFLKC